MSPELDAKLVKAYPILYADRYEPPAETCMHWGFECSDGWFDLINEASMKLEAINKKIKDPTQYIVAAQVKEKFGRLRLYVDGVPVRYAKQVESIITEAEQRSARTCEACGKAGKIDIENHWYSCLCGDCRAAQRQRKGK